MRLFLDTTVLIDVLRGRRAADRLRTMRELGEPVPWICAINVEELHRGIRPGEEEATARLVRNLQLAPLSEREGALAGSWRREHASSGKTLSQADCLIAAAAVGVGATLATGNIKHFPMVGLRVQRWPSGE